MSLNDTPSGERAHIVFFGVRNAGKSSLVNALANQTVSVVSDVAGTTTDPVRKAMELAAAGPVLIVDTPGIDDAGDVGDLRVQRAEAALNEADVAVLVVDAARGLTSFDDQLLAAFQTRHIPYVVAESKTDLLAESERPGDGDPSLSLPLAVEGESNIGDARESVGRDAVVSCESDRASAPSARVRVSARTGEGLGDLKHVLAALAAGTAGERRLVADLLAPGDVVVLVIPLDSAAPKGRIILPQQQVLRDALEAGAFPCATSVEGLPQLLGTLTCPPRLVVTDSQAFGRVVELLPASVPLTSFSILMARYKGDLPAQLDAVRALEGLTDEDTVLIAEGCTHHRTCEDIGTVKLPRWIREISGVNPQFAFTSGRDFPDDLSSYAAVVHCGGCTLNARDMASRIQRARHQGVPITNYGMVIARAHNILSRALKPLS
ncbi:GTP-binding protein [Adlercreutzia sp. R21]|uniref:GTP-binding protein n=1 Tax=Adlercreutzia wanghongyangiae TaxID=3111451 RepID=UPI002DB598E0|nr:GTP-binding protein [Adlercreutzia sp. R21]MEC4184287.1 GTP-binding protein [Adlercreutzia sp. R21]